MKQEFPTLVRVFDQTKIKKSYNLFRNLLKQAVMSDTNPEKIKKRDLSIFLTSTVLLQTSHTSEQADTRRQLEGKVGSKQTQQPKGVWPQSFIRSFPCILQIRYAC